jgi:hypothetical protein
LLFCGLDFGGHFSHDVAPWLFGDNRRLHHGLPPATFLQKEIYTIYPLGFCDQAFDAWSVQFGFYLYDQFGSNVTTMTVPSFTSSLTSYRALNPMPALP